MAKNERISTWERLLQYYSYLEDRADDKHQVRTFLNRVGEAQGETSTARTYAIFEALEVMGCIEVQRGAGGYTPSLITLDHAPTQAEYWQYADHDIDRGLRLPSKNAQHARSLIVLTKELQKLRKTVEVTVGFANKQAELIEQLTARVEQLEGRNNDDS